MQPTGIFDRVTYRAVRRFQKSRDLAVDGRVGNQDLEPPAADHAGPGQLVGSQVKEPSAPESLPRTLRWPRPSRQTFPP